MPCFVKGLRDIKKNCPCFTGRKFFKSGVYLVSNSRADQKMGGALLEFSGRTAMHRKSRVSSAIKYDCFTFDDSGNCIIRKTWLHCI